MRILVAEDEAVSRRALDRQLESWGHMVRVAGDGEEAWAAYLADDFDLVLCDWEMPRLSGLELVRRIREKDEHAFAYTIMLTGRTETDDIVAGIGAGADDFLSKPFESDELKARILAGERIVTLERDLRRTTDDLRGAKVRLQDLSDQLSLYLSPEISRGLSEGTHNTRIATRRRDLTIFFSDIVDFTETTESLDPADLTAMLNEYLEEMTAIVIEHGGTLDKYIGDAILVFFGDPATEGPEDDAYRCVSMALAMQCRLAELRSDWRRRGQDRPIHARMGIASGACDVGNFGSQSQMSYTVIGRQVNLASRLESNAEPDGILISKPTWSLVRDRVVAASADPINAKGFAHSIDVFRVLDTGHDPTGA